MRIRFVGPNQVAIDDPDSDLIRERLERGGTEYWHSNSLTASVTHVESGNQLILMVEPVVGVYVRFVEASGDNEYALQDSSKARLPEVGLYPGGEEMSVPANQLVEVELAMAAIECFLANGERLPSADWRVIGTD